MLCNVCPSGNLGDRYTGLLCAICATSCKYIIISKWKVKKKAYASFWQPPGQLEACLFKIGSKRDHSWKTDLPQRARKTQKRDGFGQSTNAMAVVVEAAELTLLVTHFSNCKEGAETSYLCLAVIPKWLVPSWLNQNLWVELRECGVPFPHLETLTQEIKDSVLQPVFSKLPRWWVWESQIKEQLIKQDPQ